MYQKSLKWLYMKRNKRNNFNKNVKLPKSIQISRVNGCLLMDLQMLFMICAREEDERNVDTGKANVCLLLFKCYNFKMTRTASNNSNN